MLCPYTVVREERFPLDPDQAPPVAMAGVLEIVAVLCGLFGRTPEVLHFPENAGLTLLYRDAVYLPRDLVESVGGLSARVEREIPLRYYGATDSRETAELSFHPAPEGAVLAWLRTVSHRRAGQFHGLGVQLDLPDRESREHLSAVLSALTPAMTGVVSRSHEGFLRQWGLLCPTAGSLFAYFAWPPETEPADLLPLLTAEHKARLWQALLADWQEPAEFDWVWAGCCAGHPLHLLEWALALEAALDRLGFRVERGEGSYRLTDGQGRQRRFDIARGGAGEKLFLKLLFPVDGH